MREKNKFHAFMNQKNPVAPVISDHAFANLFSYFDGLTLFNLQLTQAILHDVEASFA